MIRLSIGMTAVHPARLLMQYHRGTFEGPPGSEAVGLGLFMAEKHWPTSEGWTNHRAYEIPATSENG